MTGQYKVMNSNQYYKYFDYSMLEHRSFYEDFLLFKVKGHIRHPFFFNIRNYTRIDLLTIGYFFKIVICAQQVFLCPSTSGHVVVKQASGSMPKNGMSITSLAQKTRPCILSDEKPGTQYYICYTIAVHYLQGCKMSFKILNHKELIFFQQFNENCKFYDFTDASNTFT